MTSEYSQDDMDKDRSILVVSIIWMCGGHFGTENCCSVPLNVWRVRLVDYLSLLGRSFVIWYQSFHLGTQCMDDQASVS